MAASHPLFFTLETGRNILLEIYKTLISTEYSKKISEAKGNKDMLSCIHNVFPLVMKVQLDVIKKYGFPVNREGLVLFEQLIRECEAKDAEVKKLRQQIRSIYIPSLAINTSKDILV